MNSFLTTLVIKVLVITGISDPTPMSGQKSADILKATEKVLLLDKFRDLNAGELPFQWKKEE
ncbi:hypothetical protein [Salinimicrobium sp. GXAS 041]|uniref:hypothetical protein n=1 Tax=Salinimicrobium sp. GXAS 041 TaxID=3400806 RepID=UPI003C71A320